MRRLGIAAVFLLAACGTVPKPEPAVKIVPVATPVRIACVPKDFRDAPNYPARAELLNSPGPGDMLQSLTAAYLVMDQWIREAAPVIKGCR